MNVWRGNSRCEDAIAVVARKMSEETQLPSAVARLVLLARAPARRSRRLEVFSLSARRHDLRAARAAVERMAQLPADATTLRLLQRVHGADEIGLDALGDDDIAVKLRLEKRRREAQARPTPTPPPLSNGGSARRLRRRARSRTCPGCSRR